MAGIVVDFVWDDTEVKRMALQTVANAVIRVGEEASSIGKPNAPVVTGTFQRSIHSAEIDYDGAGDQDMAAAGTDLQAGMSFEVSEADDPDMTNFGLSWGSWISYAEFVEEKYGVLQAAFDQAVARFDEFLELA